MSNQANCGVWLNDIPVEQITGMEFRLTRGAEPWVVEVPVTDDRFDNLLNPVTVRIQAPDETGTRRVVELRKWYVSARVVKDEGTHALILNDPRWPATYKKGSFSFNLKWWGEADKWVQHTLNGGVPWKFGEVVQYVLNKFDLDYEINPHLPAGLLDKEFPANVTYDLGGGFFAGSFAEVMPRILEPFNCDIRPTIAGVFRVTDRSSNQSERLRGHHAVGGRAGHRDVKWAAPDKIVLHLARRIEIGLKYDEDAAQYSTSSNGGQIAVLPNVDVENVMPHVQFPPASSGMLSVPDDNNPDLTQIRHRELYEEVLTQLAKDRTWVLDHVMRPRIFPFDANSAGNPMTAERFFKESTMESWLKECFRIRYRVRKAVNGVALYGKMADLKMGRVDKNGQTAETEGNVFMDFVRIMRFSRFSPGQSPWAQGGSYLNAEFSENITYQLSVPAPFEARWVTSDIDDLMFEVQGKRKRLLDVEFWPGLLRNSLRYGDPADIADGKEFAEVESTLRLQGSFKMLVIAHGILMADHEGTTRQYEHTVDTRAGFFANLPSNAIIGPTLHIRVDDMTANFTYDGSFPGKLSNADLIKARAEEVAKQVFQTYASGRFGTVTYAGLEPLDDGVEADGDILDVAIRIGFSNLHTVELTYFIAPEIRQVSGNRSDYGTMPVSMIG